MGPWTYYSPLWIGALLVLALADLIRAGLPPMAPWAQWLAVAGLAVLSGVQCQLLMIGAQGAFAQVLPVPWGRSIRGRPAELVGWLWIAWVLLSAVTALLAYEGLAPAAWVIGGLGVADLAVAVVAYAWNVPAAVPDFRSRDRPPPGQRRSAGP